MEFGSPRSFSSFALGCLLASVAAAQSLRLHPQLEAERDVRRFQVSPDGEWVVYQADARIDERSELFAVALRGSKRPVLLAPPALQFAIDASSRVVVYRDQQGIYSVPIDGHGEARPLAETRASDVWLSPDGRVVVFRDDSGLFRVPVDGRAAPALVQARGTYAVNPASVSFTPDSRRVLYITEGSINHQGGGGHAFSAVLDGSASPVQLNTDATQASIGSFLVSPDSRRLLFRRGTAAGFSLAMLSVPVDGSAAPVVITPRLRAGSNVYSFVSGWGPYITPDSTRVVFSVDETPDAYELFSAPIDGSASAVQISTPPLEPPSGYPKTSALSPDGQWVVYGIGDGRPSPLDDLYAVPILGGVPARRVNGPLAPGDSILSFAFSPDGSRVAYRAGLPLPARSELYLVDLDDNTSARRLSDPNLTAGSTFEFDFTPDGRTLIYTTWRREGETFQELFAVSTQDVPVPRRLDGPMVPGGSARVDTTATGFQSLIRLAQDGTRVVYLADLEKDELVELFASPVSTDGTKIRR